MRKEYDPQDPRSSDSQRAVQSHRLITHKFHDDRPKTDLEKLLGPFGAEVVSGRYRAPRTHSPKRIRFLTHPQYWAGVAVALAVMAVLVVVGSW